jgi:hypothetical protein
MPLLKPTYINSEKDSLTWANAMAVAIISLLAVPTEKIQTYRHSSWVFPAIFKCNLWDQKHSRVQPTLDGRITGQLQGFLSDRRCSRGGNQLLDLELFDVDPLT